MDVFALTLRLKEEGAASVRAATDKLRTSMSQTEREAKKLDRAVLGVSSALKTMLATVGGVAVLSRFVQATSEAEFQQAALANAIRATEGAAGQSIAALNDHASALQRISTFGDEAINKAQARLLTYTNIVGDAFPRATQVVVDYAQAFGVDLVQASEAVGKALNYPSVGMAALSKQGFILTDAQKALIKELEATGRMAEAQAIIFGELESVTQGAAIAARNTLGGALQALRNAFGDLFEITNGATTGITRFINRLAFLVGALNENRVALHLVVGGLTAVTIGLVAVAFRAEIAAARMAVLAGAQMIAGFVSLARAVGLTAAAMQLLGATAPMRLAAIVLGVGGAVAAMLGLQKATNDSKAAFAEFERQLAAITAPAVLPAVETAVQGVTTAVVDQVAALLRLVELTSVTRVEAGILAREERRLQDALQAGNLSYAERVSLLERLQAVQAAQARATVRLTAQERMAMGGADLSGMIGMTPGGRTIPQIRPTYRDGQLVAGGAPTDMIATAQATLERDAAGVQERALALVDRARLAFAEQMTSLAEFVGTSMRDTFVDGIADGISEAVRSGSIGEGFKALTRSMLASLGSMLIEFGRALIPIGKLMAKLQAAMTTLNPVAIGAVALGTIALGAMLRGAAQSAFGGQAAPMVALGGGLGSLGIGSATTAAGSLAFAPTTAGRAASTLTPVQPMQVTIIGPNDAGAQRAIATLMDNAARRGLVQGPGIRTL